MSDEVLRTNDCEILGIKFDLIDFANVLETIEQWKSSGQRRYITLTNPHSVLLCHRSEQMKRATVRAGLTLPDGTGIILAARLLGYPHSGRLDGPTLMLHMCDMGRKHGYRHFFYGGIGNVAERLAERLCKLYPGLKVAGTYCPPFRPATDEEDRHAVQMINATSPDIVWIGLGAPKQERWMAAHIGRIRAAAMIGVGAAFDFHSGNVKWSPAWIRRLGMEWAYRLAQNPGRMWRRNVIDSPLFLSKVMRQRFAMLWSNGYKISKRSEQEQARPNGDTNLSPKARLDNSN
jgi:N-acetylglucosaminyldiphosphoundecaprenol N-acetyl-beta-D-mannosaminyltransferase